MQLAGNLSCPCKLHRRGVAQDEPPSPSTNLVLKNPRTGSAGAYTQTEARHVGIKEDLIGDVRIAS